MNAWLDDIWTDRERLMQWAFVAGLVGGVLILAGAFTLALMMTFVSLFWPAPAHAPAWFSPGAFPVFAVFLGVWGLAAGALVIYAAARLRGNVGDPMPWGIGMIGGGVLSFLAMGGFLLGGLAAIVGGVLAVAATRPEPEDRAAVPPAGRSPVGLP